MKKPSKKKNISTIKKKYFIKNSEITTEQIQKLLMVANEYVSSISFNYDAKVKHNIIQSVISLTFLNYNVNNQEK